MSLNTSLLLSIYRHGMCPLYLHTEHSATNCYSLHSIITVVVLVQTEGVFSTVLLHFCYCWPSLFTCLFSMYLWTCAGSIQPVWEWPLSRPKSWILSCVRIVLKKMVQRGLQIHTRVHQVLILRSVIFCSFFLTVLFINFLLVDSFIPLSCWI